MGRQKQQSLLFYNLQLSIGLEHMPIYIPFLVVQKVKHLPSMQETWVRSLGGEDPLEKEMETPLQYSCLENSMDGEAWWATVHGVTKSWTRLSDFTSLHLQNSTKLQNFTILLVWFYRRGN